ncbi:phosphomannomutase [Halobacillus andaensis]|uniref:Phosphoglucomutase n=1 Tax=Halobacillus andaensis TaxID=1176239 RepID=A0A917BAG2_HALAA|nr:phospho-sugar mutase [Halobacillus andaensis]MBP2005377.1 phosphoglucomutase [Halobacillus andaensis]GGF31019.1 phosphomannomutase [Halobacillus andaensis]
MSWYQEFERWNTFTSLDPTLRKELELLQQDEQSLEDAYYKNLEFGTGGMRGKLGPGTNRMNIYTIRRAAEGLASYVESLSGQSKGVVIAYDSRYMSKEFSVEAAKVLGRHGILTYVFSSLRPTPELSFAVRHLGATAGVVVTASHNPPQYNGFKAYNADGGQLPLEEAATVIDMVNQVENELEVEVGDQAELEASGLLKWIDSEVDQTYLEKLKEVNVNPELSQFASDLSVVFTPLHGTAQMLVEKGLQQMGITNLHTVEEQAIPDPEFSTVASPNPEEHQAFELAIEKGKQLGSDVLIATDPDADRLGIAVPNTTGDYQVLTGNQTGALLLDYLLSQSEHVPENGIVIKTIVTSEFGRVIADHYGVSSLDTLTGFKFIGEKIKEYEETKEHTFLFGYEESYGYLVKDFARDKDAVQATVLAAEVAAYWKSKGKTLLEALEDLYKKHGYFLEDLQSLTMEGKTGSEKIEKIMNDFRQNPLSKAGGLEVIAVEDYTTSQRKKKDGTLETIQLPKANVLKFILENDSWFCLRPSGTEPKIKFYYGVKTNSGEESRRLLDSVKQSVNEQINESV